MKKKIQKRIWFTALFLAVLICLMGCTSRNVKGDSELETDASMMESEEALFLIVENDSLEETLTLYSPETGLECVYAYSISTQFYDKYGNYTTAAQFTPGRIVTIGKKDKEGRLTSLQLSERAWEYEKVKRFSVDEEKGVFTIADTRYSIRDTVYILSDGRKLSFSDLSENDILTVIGIDKNILSIVVTTGHGTLSLVNTELFENSMLQLGRDFFAIITENMQLDVPEGIYMLKVANNGWGGTTQIEIRRGEITEVDLDQLKGEGRKKGVITFQIDVEDVKVYIDHVLVDHTQPQELTYGTHILEIKASGYEAFQKYLFVNSQEAVISIELTEDSSQEDTEDDTEQTTESESESEETQSSQEQDTQEDTQKETQD